MGSSLSVEEKILKCARNGEVAELTSIIHQIHRQGQDSKRFLECQDAAGQTPLIIASYRGYYPVVDLLLRNGANVSHVTRAPECNTALHEAVHRGHVQIAELLMRFGGNPFLENGRGLTSVDAAINRQHTQMLRSLELRSDFTATLLLKTPRFMGLGAEWKERWCVVMPRYQLTTGRGTVARSLLVCYKDAEACTPSTKVWLDGAVARQVVGSQGDQFLQCALALHKNHAMAANVYMTGDSSIGYTMHFRPKSNTGQGMQALQKFMDLVNGSRQNAAQARPGPSQPQTPMSPQTPPPRTPISAQAQAQVSRQQVNDAEYARILQDLYNKEWEEHKSQPPVNTSDRISQPYSSVTQPAIQSGYPDINAPHHQHQNSAASSSSFHTMPSAPLYPDINLLNSGPSTPAVPADPHAQPSEGFGQSLDWYRMNAQQASAPPKSAAQPPVDAPAPAATGAAASKGHSSPSEDEDAGQCVICLAAPATAGFLHGESVHRCCCMECAKQFKKLPDPTCPMCRQPIQHVILNFY